MEHGSRTKLVTAVILAVVLGTGVMLGLVSDGSLVGPPVEEATMNDADRGRVSERRRRTPMYEQVGPTEAQGVLIDSILEDQRQHMRSLHDEFRASYDPRYQAVIQQTREAILEVFTSEQASEYRVLLQEFDESRTQRGNKGNRD
jgi:hypothetical protein